MSVHRNGIVDCVEDARVQLFKDGQLLAEIHADNYGDFKFDRLEEGSGNYQLKIIASDCESKVANVTLGDSINVGEIRLDSR